MFPGPNKGPLGEGRRPMDPMDSAKWSVELKITMGESIRVLHKIKIFFGFKTNRFVSPNRGICRRFSAKKLL